MPVFAFRRISTIGKKNVISLSNKWTRFFALARGKNILRSSPMPEPAELRHGEQESGSAESPPQAAPDPYAELRREMVEKQIRSRGIATLAHSASERLARLGYRNVHVHCGDGTLGLPEFAPFDAILAGASAPAIPAPLAAQLAQGGRMIIPIGDTDSQELRLLERIGEGFHVRSLDPCRFVPLVGRYGWRES